MAFAPTITAPSRSLTLRQISARFRSALDQWKVRRRTAAELHALTDRDLSDIGIARFEIASVVREL